MAPLSGAVRYEVELKQTSPIPQTITSRSDIVLPEFATNHFLHPFGLSSPAASTYEAKVRGFDAFGVSTPWSASQSFQVSAPATASGTYVTDGIKPAGLQNAPVTRFEWRPISWASRYELWVGTDASPSVKTFNTIVDRPFYDHTASLPPGKYRIWVRAFDNGVTASTPNGRAGIWTNPTLFEVAAGADRPSFVGTPNLNAAALPLKWNISKTASLKHQIEVLQRRPDGSLGDIVLSLSGLDQNYPGITTDLASATGTMSLDVSNLLPRDSYSARVQSYDSSITAPTGANAKWSAPFLFMVGPVAPTFVTPFSSTPVNQTPLFSSSDVTGASSYDLQIITKSSTGSSTAIKTDVKNLSALSYQQIDQLGFSSTLGNSQSYAALVRANYPDQTSSAWTERSFTVADKVLASPVVSVIDGKPIFRWTPTSSTTSYYIWVSPAGSSSVQTIRELNATGTSYSSSVVLPKGDYTAWIRANLTTAPLTSGPWSAGASFSISDVRVASLSLVAEDPGAVSSISWTTSGVASPLFGLRVVAIDPSNAVMFESRSVTSPARLPSSIVPGVYRIDVGPVETNGKVAWTSGPIASFDGSRWNSLDASSAAPVQTSPWPNSLTGDFNGDAIEDFVSITSSGLFQPHTNNGLVLYPGGQKTWLGLNASVPLLVGDFNGDGRDDIVNPDPLKQAWPVMRASDIKLAGNSSVSFEPTTFKVRSSSNPDHPDFVWESATNSLTWNDPLSATAANQTTFEINIVRMDGLSALPVSQFTKDRSLALSTLPAGEYTVFVRTYFPAVTSPIPRNARISQWSEGFRFTKGLNNDQWKG